MIFWEYLWFQCDLNLFTEHYDEILAGRRGHRQAVQTISYTSNQSRINSVPGRTKQTFTRDFHNESRNISILVANT